MKPLRPDDAEIDVSGDVTDFFRDVVTDAMKTQRFDATDAAESYVVCLLADFAKPELLPGATLDRPLTFQLQEAYQANGQERFERLRSLGDGVLYATGFFSDHFEMRGIELEYVSSLGARAYQGASSMLRRAASAERAGPDVFHELAQNFGMFVALVSHVADAMLANSARDDRAVLKLYERWLRNGSAPLASALVSRGVLPVRRDGTLH